MLLTGDSIRCVTTKRQEVRINETKGDGFEILAVRTYHSDKGWGGWSFGVTEIPNDILLKLFSALNNYSNTEKQTSDLKIGSQEWNLLDPTKIEQSF